MPSGMPSDGAEPLEILRAEKAVRAVRRFGKVRGVEGVHRVIGRQGLIRGIGGRGVVGAAAVEVGVDSGNGCAQG